MFTSIVARTAELARRWWVRTTTTLLVSAVVALVVAAVALVDQLQDAIDGQAVGVAELLGVFALVVVVNTWAQLAPVRAASGRYGVVESLIGAVLPTLRALPLLGVVGILFLLLVTVDEQGLVALGFAVLLVVPVLAAAGDLALVPGSWGLRAFLLLGLGRTPRNLPVYVAAIGILALAFAAAAAIVAIELVVVTGGLDPVELAEFGALGVLLQLPPVLVLGVVGASLVVAVHEALTRAVDTSWIDDDEPYVPTHELSPAVAQLVGSGAPVNRRMTIPPRADAPGRVPGPGVLAVAGVDLPAGHAGRPVHAATLELALGDGAHDEPEGDPQLWVSREVLPSAPDRWKQLAAGFSETGLWPLLLPDQRGGGGVAGTRGTSAAWYEQPARREPDALEPGADVADRFQARLLESLTGGSPLRSTGLLASSATARGQLARGSGRRTDALVPTFEQVGPARLALVAARHPGECVHALAWPGAAKAAIPSQELAALIASWEVRYAALLVGMDETTLTFAVLRPPGTSEEALELVAEQHALCPDEAGGWGDDQQAAQALVDAPTWRLSWH